MRYLPPPPTPPHTCTYNIHLFVSIKDGIRPHLHDELGGGHGSVLGCQVNDGPSSVVLEVGHVRLQK